MIKKTCIILGIESSCDDTAASVLQDGKILSNVIANQQVHKQYGGVVPELASRSHLQNIIPSVQKALSDANIQKNNLTAIAYTKGPGLLGSLLVGSSFAKSLSMALQIPLIAVNHMQAHLLVHFIKEKNIAQPKFPFIGVNLSGGHTQIVLVKDYFNMEILGTTLDDAIGEAFDKIGKNIGLDYPAGLMMDELAAKGDPNAFLFPIPKVTQMDVSYSGVKTAVINFLHKNIQKNPNFIKENINNIAASVQKTLIEIIMQKIKIAVQKTQIKRVAIGGGVAANSLIRKYLSNMKEREKWEVFLPPLAYTTDNAAMIAITGYLKYFKKQFNYINEPTSARLGF